MDILIHYNNLHEYINENYCNLNYDVKYLVEATLPSIASMRNLNSLINNYMNMYINHFIISLCKLLMPFRLFLSLSQARAKIEKIIQTLSTIFRKYITTTNKKISYAGFDPLDRGGSFSLKTMNSKGELKKDRKSQKSMSDSVLNNISLLYVKEIPQENILQFQKTKDVSWKANKVAFSSLSKNQFNELKLPPLSEQIWIEFLKNCIEVTFRHERIGQDLWFIWQYTKILGETEIKSIEDKDKILNIYTKWIKDRISDTQKYFNELLEKDQKSTNKNYSK